MIAYTVSHQGRTVYVGITKHQDVAKRWAIHQYAVAAGRTKSLLHQAIRAGGAASFTVTPVACARTWEDLCVVERDLIAQHKTLWIDGGYNMTLGGEGAFGAKRGPETLAKLVTINTGRKFTDEHRAKISAAHQGKVLTPEHRAKIGRKGQTRGPETCQRIGDAHRGKVVSPEAREKIAAALRGKDYVPPETRARVALERTGSKDTPEAIANKVAAQQRRRSSEPPEVREAMSARQRGIPKPPETRAKISATLTGKKQDQATVDKRNASLRGKKRTPEQVARMTAARRARMEPKPVAQEIVSSTQGVSAMSDKLSKIRSQLNHVREVKEERAAEFWQQTILQGRMQQQTDGQQTAIKPEQKPQQPCQ